LDKQGNGFVLKRFETGIFQILSAIVNAIAIYKFLCEEMKFEYVNLKNHRELGEK